MPTNSPIEIRQAGADDAPAIAACLAAAFAPYRSQYTAQAFADTVTDEPAVRTRMKEMAIFVATIPNGTVIGTLAASVSEGIGYLRGFAVREEWQGTGVARDLLTAVEHWLIAAGCTYIHLYSVTLLHRAMGFYQKKGYTRSAHLGDFFGMPLAEFSKQLAVK